jgi:hypothetical protein
MPLLSDKLFRAFYFLIWLCGVCTETNSSSSLFVIIKGDTAGPSGQRQRVIGTNRNGRPGPLFEQFLSIRRVRRESGVPQ